MISSSNKIGFWSVFALVIGSQIGSGVFLLPANLAPYGIYGLLGWIVSGAGAIVLSLVFASLCARYPQTGGPHVFIHHAFGSTAAFFTGWTYWVVSWVSTTIVIVTCIGYLTPFIGSHSPLFYFIAELILLFSVVILNLKGVKAAGNVEFLLTMVKFVPLVLIPLPALWYFSTNNMSITQSVSELSFAQIIGRTTLLTLWGFVGVESATTPAGTVENPSQTIPRALFFGTLCVAILYLFNSIALMGLIPGQDLVLSKAPYVDAAQRIFGGNWHLLISLMAAFVCIGTLNAWTLISGQISLGLAQDRLFPRFFAQTNQNGAPLWGLMISSTGIVSLLFLTMNENLAQQIADIIDFSVAAFLFIYLFCSIGFLKLLAQQQERSYFYQWILGLAAVIFCLGVIYQIPMNVLGIASLFAISGVPLYFYSVSRKVNN